jgi:hypothetical protein
MRLVWADGFTKELVFGHHLIGQKHNERRPIVVIIGLTELLEAPRLLTLGYIRTHLLRANLRIEVNWEE